MKFTEHCANRVRHLVTEIGETAYMATPDERDDVAKAIDMLVAAQLLLADSGHER